MIRHHSKKVPRTAHYYTLGTLSEKTTHIWMVCHGYGQPADEFIRKFDRLDLDRHFIIAPEGLSRFYWGGLSGKVVSSWMTSKDRLDEIDDYTHYLQDLYTSFDQQVDARWVMFGFSQGCATMVRFMHAFRPRFEHLVLWAGSIPEDLDYVDTYPYLNSGQIDLMVGKQDQYISEETMDEQKQFFQQEKIKVNVTLFDGPHRVDRDVLATFCARLNNKVS